MSRPTASEMATALQEAARMREQQEDPHFIAKALLNSHFRIGQLERVRDAVRHYLHSGLAPHEHSVLERALAEAERADRATGETAPGFGLE